MQQNVTVMDRPIVAPGICIRCHSQNRDWFVDLGVDSTVNLTPGPEQPYAWLDGALYYCNVCINNLIVDLHRAFFYYQEDRDTVASPPVGFEQYVTTLTLSEKISAVKKWLQALENEADNEQRARDKEAAFLEELNNGRDDDTDNSSTSDSTTGDDQNVEPDDTDPANFFGKIEQPLSDD